MISVSMNTTLLYNALNRPVAMMNMARDITERKNLEEENRLQFERLRVLYELSRTLTSLLKINEIAEAVLQTPCRGLPFDAFFIDLYDEATGTVRNVICYDTIDNVKVKIQSELGETPLRPGTGITKVIAAKKSLLENRDRTGQKITRWVNNAILEVIANLGIVRRERKREINRFLGVYLFSSARGRGIQSSSRNHRG